MARLARAKNIEANSVTMKMRRWISQLLAVNDLQDRMQIGRCEKIDYRHPVTLRESGAFMHLALRASASFEMVAGL